MRDREPTIRSRELGDGLRSAMRRAGFNANQVAKQLDWSAGRVSRLLAGKRGGSVYDVTSFLSVCGAKGAEKERLLALAMDQNRRGWLQQHGSILPVQLRTYIDHENKALTISQFQFNLIPGLLQTGDYIRAQLTQSGRVPEEEIEDRISAKLGRLSLLTRKENSPRFTFYIHEFALRLPVGGPEVMSEQLHHLLRLAIRPNLTIRVVPAAIGAHAGIAGAFILLTFKGIDPLVYLDTETSSVFLELPIEINAYRSILTSLHTTALPEGQSREFISKLAVELYAEGPDDLAKEQFQPEW